MLIKIVPKRTPERTAGSLSLGQVFTCFGSPPDRAYMVIWGGSEPKVEQTEKVVHFVDLLDARIGVLEPTAKVKVISDVNLTGTTEE